MFELFETSRLRKAAATACLAIALSAPAAIAQTASGQAAAGGQAPAGAQAPAGGQAAAGSQPAATGPQWKDQAEYDMAQAAGNETDPAKKLQLLKAWQDKYPDSAFKNLRLLQFINTWTQIGAKTISTTATPDSLAQGKDAANNALQNLDAAFTAENKPANVSADQWKQARGAVEQQAHMTLGWIAWQNKDYPGAEDEFKKFIALNDQNAQVAYWLGTVIAQEKNQTRYPEALYQFARATSITGQSALNPDAKKTATDYLKKAYIGYHGDDSGLQDLMTTAAANAMPPAGWHLKSVVEIEQEKSGSEEAYLAAHPDVKLWRGIKDQLQAADGQDYFEKNMKGAITPKFNAKIVSFTPDPNPTELTISIDSAQSPNGDAVIKYAKPLHAKITPNQPITIEGSAQSFTKDPFQVVFDGDQSKITGITVEKAAPARRGPARRHK